MNANRGASRRDALGSAGIAIVSVMAGAMASRTAVAHEGHDHAPRTILDLKGKLVRIVGPDESVGSEIIQDRVTIHVDAEGRIVNLVYG